MSFGGPPVKTETAEEADELMRVDEKASEVGNIDHTLHNFHISCFYHLDNKLNFGFPEAEVLSAPPKLVYSKLILR